MGEGERERERERERDGEGERERDEGGRCRQSHNSDSATITDIYTGTYMSTGNRNFPCSTRNHVCVYR